MTFPAFPGPDLVTVWHPDYQGHIRLLEGYVAGMDRYLGPIPDWTPLLDRMRHYAEVEDRRAFMNVSRQLVGKIYDFILIEQMQADRDAFHRALDEIGSRHQ